MAKGGEQTEREVRKVRKAEGGEKTEREKREKKDKIEGEWTEWVLVMGPEGSTGLNKTRSGSGVRLAKLNTKFGHQCGIYEFAIELGEKKYPVYLGRTCKCIKACKKNKTQCGFYNRIKQYCQSGSHKGALFNQAIDHKMMIHVRTMVVKDDDKKAKNKAIEAKSSLLEKYDYAWNLEDNDKKKSKISGWY